MYQLFLIGVEIPNSAIYTKLSMGWLTVKWPQSQQGHWPITLAGVILSFSSMFAQPSQFQYSFYPHTISLWNNLSLIKDSSAQHSNAHLRSYYHICFIYHFIILFIIRLHACISNHVIHVLVYYYGITSIIEKKTTLATFCTNTAAIDSRWRQRSFPCRVGSIVSGKERGLRLISINQIHCNS